MIIDKIHLKVHQINLKFFPRKYEVIFVHIPKTAGSSIQELARFNRFTVQGHDLRNPSYQDLYLYQKDKKDVFSFAFVRNPWDRLVSSFFYLQDGGNCAEDNDDKKKYLSKWGKLDFDKFVKDLAINNEILKQIHFKPQHEWIFKNGICLVNKIYPFEKLTESLSNINQNIEKTVMYNLKHINKSNRKDYREYYNKDTIKIVANVYKKDIQYFGYEF